MRRLLFLNSLFLTITFLTLVLRPANADRVRLKCVADTNISSYSGEQNLNYGQSPRIRLKGIEMMGLFKFDLTEVAGWRVKAATLFMRYAGGDRKLRTLGFSTISAPWDEGTGSAEAKPGETTFLCNGPNRWDGPDTDFTDISFTAGNTRTAYADITLLEGGWLSVPVDPSIVQAMIAGASYGMAVTDEKGQTMANNDVYSKEQNGSAPYLEVERERVPSAVPSAVTATVTPDAAHADFDTGAVKLTLMASAGTYTYNLRIGSTDEWQTVPRARIPFATPGHGQVVTLRGLRPGSVTKIEIVPLTLDGVTGRPMICSCAASPAKTKPALLYRPVRRIELSAPSRQNALIASAYSDTEKANPISGNLLEEAGVQAYSNGAATSMRDRNAVWDGKNITLYGARNEVLAFQFFIDKGTKDAVHGISILAPKVLIGAAARSIEPAITLYRDWYVNANGWFPEACIPLNGPFDIPAADNKVPGQRNQSIFVDLRIPADAPPGDYHGTFTVSAPGSPDVKVPVVLDVNSLTLPGNLSFDISLNTYGTLGGLFGVNDGTAEYREIEKSFQRMAHDHRSTLAALGYSHSGNVSTNYAPPVEGQGAATHVTDWSKWDAQFGPYLDGSAFTDTYRKGVPITHLYLPFHEAWPVDIRKHYTYTQTITEYPAMIAEHAMTAMQIEQAIDQQLRDGFRAVAKQFADHIREKGWTHTQFQFYQNDKFYYKDPKMGGRGTSWWLLDEPNHRDDWLALAFFNRLFQAGAGKPPTVPMVIREDVSRPQWQRDYLDGLVDVMCVSNELFEKRPRLREMQETLGVKYWNYGAANAVNRSNTEAEGWAVRAWLYGADAIVPWQSIGEDKNFEQPEDTALLLPGTRFGIKGPVASLRLKALRRAQQDVEYLALLAKKRGWDREQVAAAIKDLFPLKASVKKTDELNAGSYQFGALHAADFDAVRRAIGM